MVRRAERAVFDQRHVRRQLIRHRVDPRDVERLIEGEARQNGGKGPRKKRLAGARRADQQHVVSAGGRHLERAFGMFLPADFFQCRVSRGSVIPVQRIRVVHLQGLGRLDHAFSGEVADECGDMLDGENLQIGDQRRFAGIAGRDEHTLKPQPAGEHGHRKHAAHMADRSVEREFSDHQRCLQLETGDLVRCHQEPERDRQIVSRPLLAQVGRREVDRHPPVRERQAGVLHRRLDPLAAFLDGRIRQADDDKRRHPVGDVHLRLHNGAVESDDRTRRYSGQHSLPLGAKDQPKCSPHRKHCQAEGKKGSGIRREIMYKWNNMIPITSGISLKDSELEIEFLRASGPGGQNVNKVATAVQLRFDVRHSPSLRKRSDGGWKSWPGGG